MEYLLLVGIFLAALVPIFIYSLDSTYASVRSSQAQEAVQSIATAADNLYKLGGGKTTIMVNIPAGTESIVIANKTIRLKVRIGGVLGDALAFTEANVNGSVSTKEELKKITLEVVRGTVQIS